MTDGPVKFEKPGSEIQSDLFACHIPSFSRQVSKEVAKCVKHNLRGYPTPAYTETIFSDLETEDGFE